MKKKIAITIDEEIYAQLERLSNEEDRTISGQINKIQKTHLAQHTAGSKFIDFRQPMIISNQ